MNPSTKHCAGWPRHPVPPVTAGAGCNSLSCHGAPLKQLPLLPRHPVPVVLQPSHPRGTSAGPVKRTPVAGGSRDAELPAQPLPLSRGVERTRDMPDRSKALFLPAGLSGQAAFCLGLGVSAYQHGTVAGLQPLQTQRRVPATLWPSQISMRFTL